MSCNGCQALRGPLRELTTPLTITATGFTFQEVLRVTVPPMADPVKLRGIARPSSLLTATTVGMTVLLAPAGSTSLNALDQDARVAYPFTDVNPAGHYTSLTAWIEEAGDYVLGAVKGAGNGQLFASVLSKTQLWWER